MPKEIKVRQPSPDIHRCQFWDDKATKEPLLGRCTNKNCQPFHDKIMPFLVCYHTCQDYTGPRNDQILTAQQQKKKHKKPAAPIPVHQQGNGDCHGCPGKQKKRTFLQMARGAIGITKEVLGIDTSSEEKIKHRWKVCSECDKFDYGICRLCGCHLSAKVRVKSEKCPAGKWN